MQRDPCFIPNRHLDLQLKIKQQWQLSTDSVKHFKRHRMYCNTGMWQAVYYSSQIVAITAVVFQIWIYLARLGIIYFSTYPAVLYTHFYDQLANMQFQYHCNQYKELRPTQTWFSASVVIHHNFIVQENRTNLLKFFKMFCTLSPRGNWTTLKLYHKTALN